MARWLMNNIERNIVILTGRIGSGKSTAARFFKEFGATVFSADEFSRSVIEPGHAAYIEIVNQFSDSILNSEQRIDRKALGKIVFSDPIKLRALENIIHPKVRELAIATFKRELERDPRALIVYECPLFFETELSKIQWRHVILLTASNDLVGLRVGARDGLLPEEIVERLSQQMSDDRRLLMLQTYSEPHTLLENNTTIDDLRSKVKELYSKLANE